MRDAGGKLTDRLQVSASGASVELDLLPLLDLSDELPVGCGQFFRAFPDTRFQGFVQAARACLGLPRMGFALMQSFKAGTCLVLPLAPRKAVRTTLSNVVG